MSARPSIPGQITLMIPMPIPKIPTHKVLQIELEAQSDEEERSYAKTLPPLRRMLEDKIEKEAEGKGEVNERSGH